MMASLATLTVALFGAPSRWAGATIAAAAVALALLVGRGRSTSAAAEREPARAAGAAIGVGAALFVTLFVASRLPLPVALAAHHPRWLALDVLAKGLIAFCALTVGAAYVGARVFVATRARLGHRALGGLAGAAFALASALVCFAATRPGGAASVDSDAWIHELARVGRLDESPEEKAARDEARRAHAPLDQPATKRFDDGIVVTQRCDHVEMARTCTAEIDDESARRDRADGASARGPLSLVVVSPSPLLPDRDADFATSDRDPGPSVRELWTDHAGAWFVTRDGVLVDAASERRHLRFADVASAFAIPELAIVVAVLGLLAAILCLARGARWARFSLEVARGVSGEITADGWLETPGRDAVRVKQPGAAVAAGPVVVLARGARAPSYRTAPTGGVNYATGDKATLGAVAGAQAAALYTTALAVVVASAAPLAAAALVLG
jgi:hypothetical protein